METNATSKVLLVYTGGTIGMHHNLKTGALEPFDFEHLLSRVPELTQLPTDISTYQFNPPIDSSDMSPKLWTDLAHIISDRYDQFDGFVVLHGTDTMAYTASALSFMLQNLTKPVILTGSQLPIGQLRTDGKENLITSIEIAAARHPDGRAIVPEVCIYFSGHLMRGNRTTKQSADEFNAFESFNYPHLADAGVQIIYHEDRIHQPDFSRPMEPHFRLDTNVVIFSLFPGVRETPGEGGGKCQPVHAGLCGDVTLRHRAPAKGGWRGGRTKQHGRGRRHEADVPAGEIRRCRHRAPAHGAEHLRGNVILFNSLK